MSDDRHIESDFIDRLYAVAMEPERFTELVEVWQTRLNHALAKGEFAAEAEIAHLDTHIGRAEMLLKMADDRNEHLPHPIADRMEAEPHPMLAVDAEGIIRAQNNAARLAFKMMEDQSISDLPFDSETKNAISKFGESDRARNKPSLLMRGYREDQDRSVLLSLAETETASSRRLTLVRLVDFTWPDAITPLVREAFDLTSAEIEVLRLFAEGHSPAEIAGLRSASLPTVRTQIRMIYDKTDTRNQAELIRMAVGLGSLDKARGGTGGPEIFSAPDVSDAPFPRPEDRRLLELPDGRILDYSVFGDPEGEGGVCLFLHMEFFADAWPAEGVRRASELGVKIVAPLRPYYGRSDAGSQSRIGPAQLAQDTVNLLDHLGIEQVVPVFQMAGGLTAAELARLYPERLAGLVPVAPMFPMGQPEDDNRLTVFHNYLASITHRHPRLLDFMTRSGFAYLRRVGIRRFLQTFAKERQADLDLVENDATFAIMARGAELCGGHGHHAFANDYHSIPPYAERSFLSLDRPFIAVVGDGVVERRNRRLDDLIARHSRSRRILAENAAHYLHFSHSALMAEAVAQAWESR